MIYDYLFWKNQPHQKELPPMFNLVLKKQEKHKDKTLATLSEDACIRSDEDAVLSFMLKARASGFKVEPNGRVPVTFQYGKKKVRTTMDIQEFVTFRGKDLLPEQEGYLLEITDDLEFSQAIS
jgi:hypothetical protein